MDKFQDRQRINRQQAEGRQTGKRAGLDEEQSACHQHDGAPVDPIRDRTGVGQQQNTRDNIYQRHGGKPCRRSREFPSQPRHCDDLNEIADPGRNSRREINPEIPVGEGISDTAQGATFFHHQRTASPITSVNQPET